MAAPIRDEFLALDLLALRQPHDLAFEAHQAPIQALELVHQLLDPIVVQLHLLHQRDQFAALLLIGLLRPLRGLAARGVGVHPLGRELVQLGVVGLNRLEGGQRLGLQLLLERRERQAEPAFAFLAFLELLGLGRGAGDGFGVVGAGGRFQVDHVAQQDAALLDRVMPGDDGLESQRALAEPTDHHVAAGLDPLGDRDLALARQQLDAAHLAQIHADRVVGAAEGGFIDIAAGFLVLLLLLGLRDRLGGGGFAVLALLVLNDIDAEVGQHRHRVLDRLGGHLL